VLLPVKSTTAPLSLLGLLVMVASLTLRAADPIPAPPLEVARIDFERTLIESSLTPLKKHLSELSLLEKQYAEARDYGGAIDARDLRRKVEDELDRLDKELLLLQTRKQSLTTSRLPDRIPLKIADAQLSGVTREGGALTRWSKPGASATWKLSELPPGGYEVILRYRCGPLEGGSVLVQEAKFALSGDIVTTLKGPEERNLGTLKVTDGSGPLKIAARTVVKDNLMQLLAVELVPASR
jgi:hypothetical protein